MSYKKRLPGVERATCPPEFERDAVARVWLQWSHRRRLRPNRGRRGRTVVFVGRRTARSMR